MIIYLIGKITEVHSDSIYLESNNGIGYEIFVNSKKEFVVNSTIKLYIYSCIRNEELSLYGFSEYNSYKLFKLLIKVNGVGPKTAQQILKNVNINIFIKYINEGLENELSKISGVGAKAPRIIAELKGKLDNINIKEIKHENVFNALIYLGYRAKEITEILNNIDANLDESSVLKLAIRGLKNEH